MPKARAGATRTCHRGVRAMRRGCRRWGHGRDRVRVKRTERRVVARVLARCRHCGDTMASHICRRGVDHLRGASTLNCRTWSVAAPDPQYNFNVAETVHDVGNHQPPVLDVLLPVIDDTIDANQCARRHGRWLHACRCRRDCVHRARVRWGRGRARINIEPGRDRARRANGRIPGSR